MKRIPGTTGKRHITSLFFVFFLASAGPLAAKEIYSWADADGVPHYSDIPPDGFEAQPVEIPDPVTMQAAAPTAPAADGAADQPLEQGTLCADHQSRLDTMLGNRDVSYVDTSGVRHELSDAQYDLLIQESRAYLKLRCD